MKKQGVFTLDEMLLQEIITPLQNEFKDIKYTISRSTHSKSLYVYLQKEETILALRIADHPTKLKWHKNEIIITADTQCSQVVKKLRDLSQSLYIKRTRYLLDKIKKED